MEQETTPTPILRPTLEEVRDKFQHWRNNKQGLRRIPDVLWQAAVELCKDRSILGVSRALRLNYTDLKHRVQGTEKIAPSSSGYSSEFVEVDFGQLMLSSECVVELETPNGAKMKMYFKGQQHGFDAVALSKAFWRQGL
jgi:hypothetical protein